MKTLRAFLFVSMVSFLVPAAYAEGVSNAKISESVSVYIPAEGRSVLLTTGTPAQVIMTEGKNAVISLSLQNGYSVQTQIPTKYLTILPPQQDLFTDSGFPKPKQVATSLVKPPVGASNPDANSADSPASSFRPIPSPMAAPSVVATSDFFNIEELTFRQAAAPGEPQGSKAVPQLDRNNQPVLDKNKKPVMKQVPIPFLAVHVSVKAQVRADSVRAMAYFYDENRQLIHTDASPSMKDWSVFISKDKKRFIRFDVPDQVLSQPNWSAVVVFGDAKGVDAQAYSNGNQVADYDFPEKNILEDKSGPPIERKIAMDPLIEHVEKTQNPDQPQITLFMRPPLGMTDASQAKGVLCLCLLADDVGGVKHQLQGFKPGQDVGGILKYAEKHQLIIICWGSHSLWDPTKNWDQLGHHTALDADKAFDQVADAWADGIQYFVKEYGIPSNDYLLCGFSGSAQYACRLALRKPEYFLAIHAHIPSSFDKPTPEASKILWCLTTGELEAGHERSLRFYEQCRALGYPMIYKAIPGLGHDSSSIADNIGFKFFDYALSVRDQRAAHDGNLDNPLMQLQRLQQSSSGQAEPWIESFRKPAFVGDVLNQGIFPSDQVDMVLPELSTSLPTKAIADAWNK